MYLVVNDHAMSAILLRLDLGIQKLIFYISKTIVEAQMRYLPLEKAALAVIHAVQRLPH